MLETKRLWNPRTGDQPVEVSYVSVRARGWQLRKLLPRMRGTWALMQEGNGSCLVRGWGISAEDLARTLSAYGYESHALKSRLDWR